MPLNGNAANLSEELSRTALTLECFSACPEINWAEGWPAAQPLIINRTDIEKGKVGLCLIASVELICTLPDGPAQYVSCAHA